ncbi:hypothetical protein HPDFL43_01495 [Hoeflea phototrophica DFL-43]|uniref:Uncharacterized protein n=1 Tax=Hoeflea phototrophica (strain DSM 17068 / NCIMB 14078 / DFL-43) TaxID=411684 RepID=A9CZS1_HOEPD|nr:hypothetical protein [Hoeflea phototrophica]EDQ34830.1 hypothetical protein HPDFL43_01495 [Hoeflea phototrophica DFL-43]
MSRAADNTRLYAATVAIFAVGVISFLLMAPINKRASPYWHELDNGCFMLFATAVLDQPGCFELQEDVVLEGDNDYFLYINSSDVQVNLKGKAVTGPGQSSTQSGIYINGGDNIKIANGSIAGFLFGIRGEPTSDGEPIRRLMLSNLKVSDASLIGITLDVNEVSMSGITVIAPQEVQNKKYDYFVDIRVNAQTCYYEQDWHEAESLKPPRTQILALQADCELSK